MALWRKLHTANCRQIWVKASGEHWGVRDVPAVKEWFHQPPYTTIRGCLSIQISENTKEQFPSLWMIYLAQVSCSSVFFFLLFQRIPSWDSVALAKNRSSYCWLLIQFLLMMSNFLRGGAWAISSHGKWWTQRTGQERVLAQKLLWTDVQNQAIISLSDGKKKSPEFLGISRATACTTGNC